MGLKAVSIWRRLSTLLRYHQTLVKDNRDKKRMVQAERRIRHLTYLLERLNSKQGTGSLRADE